MATLPAPPRRDPDELSWPQWADAVRKQFQVIGALIMRELHTRYGRENIGYLWLIGEPLMLGSVIGLLHSGRGSGGHHGAGVTAVAFTIVGYTIFIMFRGIVNRSEGTLEANAPLLYHRMVTIPDVIFAKAVLEAAGTFLSYCVLTGFLIAIGQADFPARPLYLLLAIFYVFWLSVGQSLIIVGGTYKNAILERLVHPYTYFMIPLSGSFFQVEWLPEPYRTYIQYNPIANAFELLRYGQFEAMNDRYVNYLYLFMWAMTQTVLGLYVTRNARNYVHL